MPVYQYTCKMCGFMFKDVEKPKGGEPRCPLCENGELEKADISVPGDGAGSCGRRKKTPFR